MNLRHLLLQLAQRHQLDHQSHAELQLLAGLRGQPAWLPARLPQAVGVAGAALLGLGLVFLVASNWDGLGRFGRIGLLQAVLAASLLAAWLAPAVRTFAALGALLATGALFACLGQTYQTGADPWQLFALWAALCLPLCLGLRSDVLWMPWLAVAATAIGLGFNQFSAWNGRPHGFWQMVPGWLLFLCLAGLMLPPLRRWTGAGAWSLRLAVLAAMAGIALPALALIFDSRSLHVLLPFLLIGAAIVLLARYDLAATSLAGIALLTLSVVGCARVLYLLGVKDDPLFLLTGLFAILLISVATSALLALQRKGVQP